MQECKSRSMQRNVCCHLRANAAQRLEEVHERAKNLEQCLPHVDFRCNLSHSGGKREGAGKGVEKQQPRILFAQWWHCKPPLYLQERTGRQLRQELKEGLRAPSPALHLLYLMHLMSFSSSSPWLAASCFSGSCQWEQDHTTPSEALPQIGLFLLSSCWYLLCSRLGFKGGGVSLTLVQDGVRKPHLWAGGCWASGALQRVLQLLLASVRAAKLLRAHFQGVFVLKPVMFSK